MAHCQDTQAEYIAKGAELLDKKYPYWENNIDYEKFSQSDGFNAGGYELLWSLYGSKEDACKALDIPCGHGTLMFYGFTIIDVMWMLMNGDEGGEHDPDSSFYIESREQFRSLWKKQIDLRRYSF